MENDKVQKVIIHSAKVNQRIVSGPSWYKHESFELEKKQLVDRNRSLTKQNDRAQREVTRKTNELQTETENAQRLLMEKNDEMDQYRAEIKNLELMTTANRDKMRAEFDRKLGSFIDKREEQYKMEKEEWMRIFKDEFNRKLKTFKEQAAELNHSNFKLSEELEDFRYFMFLCFCIFMFLCIF